MADKYFIFGAAFNGDGTTASEAASNGAAGAWSQNSILTGTTPTYGTLAAGDVVYVRSKTGAGADLDPSLTLSASSTIGAGSAVATTTAWIRWILDNGVKWSGIDGTLTIAQSNNAYGVTFRDYNSFEAMGLHKWVFKHEHAAATNSNNWVQSGINYLHNVLIDGSTPSYSSLGPVLFYQLKGGQNSNLKIKCGSKVGVPFNHQNASNSGTYCYNLEIELPVAPSAGKAVFEMLSSNSDLIVYGGSLTGAAATTGTPLCNMNASGTRVSLNGFAYPIDMQPTAILATPSAVAQDFIAINGVGLDGELGAMRIRRWGYADSRGDGNYPVLTATLPDSANTAWSWKVYPINGSIWQQIELPLLLAYTDAAATKTLTVDLLVRDTSTVHKGSLWIDVSYVDDTTGATKHVSSIDLTATAALDTSTEGWSTLTYGAATYVKRQIAVTTPTAIKQDTMVTTVLRGTHRSASAADVFFVEPVPRLS